MTARETESGSSGHSVASFRVEVAPHRAERDLPCAAVIRSRGQPGFDQPLPVVLDV